MNRRAFLTALSAIPAVALFPAVLRAEPGPRDAAFHMFRLHKVMCQMATQGDAPDAFFVTPDVVHMLAKAFGPNIKVVHDEFECPWGFDIVGTPHVEEGHIDVSCRDSGVLYFFEWGSHAYVRKDPKELNAEWNRYGHHTGHLKAHLMELPNW